MLKAVAIAALLATTPATPPPPTRCVSKNALNDMIVIIAPVLIDALRQKCRTNLPASAFLNEGAADLTARLRAAGTGREASAAGVMQMFAGKELPEIQDKKALIQVMRETLANKFAQGIKPGQCGAANDFLEALAPLPADNFGRVITSFFRLAEVRDPPICPDA